MEGIIGFVAADEHREAVVSAACWAAARHGVPVEFVHVLERPGAPEGPRDLSGAIGLGAQEDLREDLARRDEAWTRHALEVGRRLLREARAQALAAGAAVWDCRMRHGELQETVEDLGAAARLFVMGEHARAEAPGSLTREHHVEQVLRSARQAVLVVSGFEFHAPQQAYLALPARMRSRDVVERLAVEPLLQGLSLRLGTLDGGADAAAAERLTEICAALLDAGLVAEVPIARNDVTERPSWPERASASSLMVTVAAHHRLRGWPAGGAALVPWRTSCIATLVMR